MDFKVAGTQAGVTALQMDIKMKALRNKSWKWRLIVENARMHILGLMKEAIDKPREDVSEHALVLSRLKLIRIKSVM